jgi:hypothetical protein
MWYDLSLGKYKVKYTPIHTPENEYPDVDEKGMPLKRISGNFTRGYFINEKTGEKHDKAFKLINGQVSSGWTGRIKEVKDNEMFFVDEAESEDLITEHTNLVESRALFDELKEKKQAVIFAGFFGNGFKVYKCYVIPSKIYDGFCLMRCGRGQLSEQITNIVCELTEYRKLKAKVEEIELKAKKVNNINPLDIIKIQK